MNSKIGFVSLGCPKNLTVTETMIGLLSPEYEVVTNPAEADIIIVNTCGFIESAKQESVETIIEMGQYKDGGNLKKLIVTGCLAERYTEDILEQLPEVDAVVGTGSYFEIKKIIDNAAHGERVTHKNDINTVAPENLPRVISTGGASAYLAIADGCNNHCTYCVIPSLRGKYRSRKMEDILAEARSLAEKGYKELIVIAQDTTMYGIDLYKEKRLAALVRELDKIDGIEWIRLHYCYPESVTDELIEVMANSKKVCKYIDIPFQHASDSVLKRMGRRGKEADYRALVEKLRITMPDITIRSTFITGFPGETAEDFEALMKFVNDTELDKIGVFAYSREEGTPAAEMEDQIDEEVKETRRDALMALGQEISLDKNKSKIGRTIKVLAEEQIKKDTFAGRSEGDSPDVDGMVIFKSKNAKIGEFADVVITKASEYDLEGVADEYCK